MMKPELLAPAGNIESLKAAINNGADAVYLGLGQMNARAKAEGFDEDNISDWIKYANLFGVKVYITLNTLVKDNEFEVCYRLAKAAVEANAEAFIVQDLGLLHFLREHFPNCHLHASTQMGIHNKLGAEFIREKGVIRAVLSRECSLQDIREISSLMETEVFVQGALCVSFSGNCYLSSSIFSCSGNRGKCLQPCRKRYQAYCNDRFMGDGYLLSPADLCVGERINDLLDAGVHSFKIEGRLRRSEYVAAAVKYYRDLLDGNTASLEKDFDYLKRMFNRGDYTRGYAFGLDSKKFICRHIQGHKGVPAGTVRQVKRNRICVIPSETFREGDAFKILTDGQETGSAVFQSQYFSDKNCELSYHGKAQKGSQIFKTTDISVLKAFNQQVRRIPLSLTLTARVGQALKLSVTATIRSDAFQQQSEPNFLHLMCEAEGAPVERAQNRATEISDIIKHLNRLTDTPFLLERSEIHADPDCFLPVSALNRIRREAIDSLLKKAANLSNAQKVLYDFSFLHSTLCVDSKNSDRKTAAIVRNAGQLQASAVPIDMAILRPDRYTANTFSEFLKATKSLPCERFLFLPNFLSNEECRYLASISEISGFSGFFCNNVTHLYLARQLGKKVFTGPQLNLMNRLSFSEIIKDFPDAVLCASNELNRGELALLGNEFSFFLYAYGASDCMTLLHCPIQAVTGKDCKACSCSDGWIYRDEKKSDFPIIRQQVLSCRFFLKNSIRQNLLTKFNGVPQNCLFDFTMDSSQQIKKITEYYSKKKSGAAAAWEDPYTAGCFLRGV